MARPSGPLIRCGGRWTEAKFHAFIKNALRGATRRWAPISDCKKRARVARGLYLCNGCKQEVPASLKDGSKKRRKNVFVDHIEPIIDPEKGFVSWDDVIERMFCEEDNLQVLCGDCHDKKTVEERAAAKNRRARVGN